MAIGNMHKNLVKIGWYFHRYAHGQTNTQTDRHGHHNTLLPYRGGVIEILHIRTIKTHQRMSNKAV